jgi:hypothetical protein
MQQRDLTVKFLSRIKRAAARAAALIAVASLGWSFTSEAAKITQVKGGQVLIDTSGNVAITEGARYYVIIDGKKKGAVEVTKVKGSKAIAKILKGKAEVDSDLQPLSPPPTAATAKAEPGKDEKKEEPRTEEEETSPTSGKSYGLLVGVGLDSQTVTSPLTSVSTATTGTGYSAKAFGDLQISGPLGVIARLGAEQINLSGAGNANTNILYATGDVLLRYNFLYSEYFAPFVSLGMGLHFPLAKSSTLLDTPNISSTMVFFGGLGFTFSTGDTSYLLVQAEYGYFPSTTYVSTSITALRAGMGFNF